MRKPETKVVQKIIEALEKAAPQGYFRKIHGNEFQQAGIPDILGCAYGIFIAIEVKDELDEKPEKIQEHEMKLIRLSGGIAGVAYNTKDALVLLEIAKRCSMTRENHRI